MPKTILTHQTDGMNRIGDTDLAFVAGLELEELSVFADRALSTRHVWPAETISVDIEQRRIDALKKYRAKVDAALDAIDKDDEDWLELAS